MKRWIHAAENVEEVPAQFSQYFRPMSDTELCQYGGYEPNELPFSDNHVMWIIAKDEYLDALQDDALDWFEVVYVPDTNSKEVGYYAGGRFYPTNISEIKEALHS